MESTKTPSPKRRGISAHDNEREWRLKIWGENELLRNIIMAAVRRRNSICARLFATQPMISSFAERNFVRAPKIQWRTSTPCTPFCNWANREHPNFGKFRTGRRHLSNYWRHSFLLCQPRNGHNAFILYWMSAHVRTWLNSNNDKGGHW